MQTRVQILDDEGKVINQQVSELSPHSIELSRTTRGYTWTIKHYYGDGAQEKVIEDLAKIDQQLRANFLATDPRTKEDDLLADIEKSFVK